jgi:hypothetical protein
MNKQEKKDDNTIYDMDMDEELKQFEQSLKCRLDEYDVEYPSEVEIMMTIDAIRPYVPNKENKSETLYSSISSIMNQALNEVFFIRPIFWILNGIFLLAGLTAVFLSDKNPYQMIMFLAPIPTITGLFEVVKSRNTAMDELEMSFKYNLQEIILSKMLVIGGFNFFMNMIFIFTVSMHYQEIWVWELMMYCAAPFTVITALSLVIVSRFRSVSAVTMSLAVWILIGGLMSQMNIGNKIESISPVLYILITLLASIFIMAQIKRICQRGVHYEFNH